MATLAEDQLHDLVVLGGGPAGYAAALYGAAAGLDVALVEEDRVGGTCLHRGCIPAKELLQTAEVLRTIQGASDYGIDAGLPILDLAQAQVRKQEIVDRLTKGTESLLRGRNVTVLAGRGEVVDVPGHRVRLADGTEVAGRNLLVATGSSPNALPGLSFDGTRVLSSDHVLTLTEVPARVAIIGGGVIGVEFASMLADMGSAVTVLEALPRIMATTDADVGNVLARSFRRRGIDVHAGIRITGIDGARELTVTWDGESGAKSVTVDKVIVSVGRSPRTSGIGLEGMVAIDDRGYVVVDGNMRSNVDGVYAAGDVVATPALAHVGFAEAIVVVKTILGENAVPIDYGKVPWVVYSYPGARVVRAHRGAGARARPRRRRCDAPLRR